MASMKHNIFGITLLLFSLIAFGQGKQECSLFWANFVGVDAALEFCAPTPKFIAWVKEEQARIATEERARQEEAVKTKQDEKAPPE